MTEISSLVIESTLWLLLLGAFYWGFLGALVASRAGHNVVVAAVASALVPVAGIVAVTIRALCRSLGEQPGSSRRSCDHDRRAGRVLTSAPAAMTAAALLATLPLRWSTFTIPGWGTHTYRGSTTVVSTVVVIGAAIAFVALATLHVRCPRRRWAALGATIAIPSALVGILLVMVPAALVRIAHGLPSGQFERLRATAGGAAWSLVLAGVGGMIWAVWSARQSHLHQRFADAVGHARAVTAGHHPRVIDPKLRRTPYAIRRGGDYRAPSPYTSPPTR